jgi:hypothetical protein
MSFGEEDPDDGLSFTERLERWRAATHTSTPAPEHKKSDKKMNACQICRDKKYCGDWLKQHDAQVAKAEREQIIKELESWNPFQRTFGNVLEALRQPDPQQTTCHPRYGRNTRTGLEKTDNETRRSNEQLSGIGKDCS